MRIRFSSTDIAALRWRRSISAAALAVAIALTAAAVTRAGAAATFTPATVASGTPDMAPPLLLALNPQPLPPGRARLRALNPQPLPPGRARLRALNPQPLPPGRRADRFNELNPQPLPPGRRAERSIIPVQPFPSGRGPGIACHRVCTQVISRGRAAAPMCGRWQTVC